MIIRGGPPPVFFPGGMPGGFMQGPPPVFMPAPSPGGFISPGGFSPAPGGFLPPGGFSPAPGGFLPPSSMGVQPSGRSPGIGVLPRGSARVTSAGTIVVPAAGGHTYATILGRDGVNTLTNLLVSPDSGLLGREDDNVFRQIILSSDGRLLRQENGQLVEFRSDKTIQELRAYLEAQGLSQDPRVQAFLNRQPGDSSPGRSPAPPKGDHTPKDGGRGRPAPPSTSLPPEADPVVPPSRGKAGPAPAPSDTRPSGPPRRFAMTVVTRELRGQADGQTVVFPRSAGGCGSTPVYKKALEGGQCDFGIFTAAHCVTTEADFFFGGDPKKIMVERIDFTTPEGRSFTVSASEMTVRVGERYRGRERRTVVNGRVQVQRVNSPDDEAMIFFKAPCETVSDAQVAKFGPSTDIGGGVSGARVVLGERIAMGTARGTTKAVVRAPDQFPGFRIDPGDQFVGAMIGQGIVIPGDSGGPVYNERNELIGAISRNMMDLEGNVFAFSWDPKGITWAQRLIQQREQSLAAAPPPRVAPAPPKGKGHDAAPGTKGGPPLRADAGLVPPVPAPKDSHEKGGSAPKRDTPKTPDRAPAAVAVDFECVSTSSGYMPRHKTVGKLLGRNGMPREACERAVQASRNGIVCSHTGLGWKPTHRNGTTQYRPDFGFWGSSINNLDDCLKTTLRSTSQWVCYWGGTGWYIADINGSMASLPGVFSTVDACTARLNPSGGPAPKAPPVPDAVPKSPPVPDVPAPRPKTPDAPPKSAGAGHGGVLGQSCLRCHGGRGPGQELPSWFDNQKEIERRLASTNAAEARQAKELVRQLARVLVHDKTMPPSETERKRLAADANSAAFLAFLKGHSEASADRRPASADSAPKLAPNRVQILPEAKLAAYRKMLPKVADPALQRILDDPNTLFFDKESLPPAYQDPSFPVVGVRSTPDGTFVKDAPFLTPQGHLKVFHKGFGLENSDRIETFHFMSLPRDSSGALQKIRFMRSTRNEDDGPLYDWVFPVGTVSGEVVVATDSAGRKHVLEIRVRTKDSATGPWKVDLLRPYPTAASLRESLAKIEASSPELAGEAKRVRAHLDNPNRLVPISLSSGGYDKGNFGVSGATDVLPEMSEGLVRRLLDTPFRSVVGTEWDRNGTRVAFAPTTRQSFGLAPHLTNAGALPVDRNSCNRCHGVTNTPIRNLYNPHHPDMNGKIWLYGNTPGSDGNLRWNPWDPSAYRNFGFQGAGDNRRLRREFLPILDVQR